MPPYVICEWPLTWAQVVELTFLRAICHHALGEFAEAVVDYDKCLAHGGEWGGLCFGPLREGSTL